MNLVSIVIVTHSRPAFLESCLQSCAQQDYASKEIVVVLNPPDSPSETIAQKYNTRIFRTHRNLGFFPALNLGIANSEGTLVMVVDDDAYFASTSVLTALVSEMFKQPNVAIVTCNTTGPCEGPPFPKSSPVHSFKTGFTLFRREVFTEWVGYVPDRFFRAGGETFLSNYVYERGQCVRVLADAWMVHAQTSVGRSNRAMNYYAVRNHALIVLLQEPLAVVLPSLIAKVGSTFLRIGWQRRDLVAWFTGWCSVLGNLGWALKQRRAISLSTFRRIRRLRDEGRRSKSASVNASATREPGV